MRRTLIVLGVLLLILALLVFLPVRSINGRIDQALARTTAVYLDLETILDRYPGLDAESLVVRYHQMAVTDRHRIEQLREALRCRNQGLFNYWICACAGYPRLRLDDGTLITVHHAQSVRIPGEDGNFTLVDGRRIDQWLREVGWMTEREILERFRREAPAVSPGSTP